KRFRLHTQAQEIEKDLSKSRMAEEMSQEKVSDLQKRVKQLQEEIEACKLESSKKREELDKVVGIVEEKKKRLADYSTLLKEQDQEIETLKKSQEDIRRQLVEAQTKQQILEKLESDLEGYSLAAKSLLKEAKKPKSPLFGKVFSLADVISVEV